MPTNTLPNLLDAARPTLNDLAAWAGVSRGLANFWREGKMRPRPAKRRLLLRALRRHVARLDRLIDAVEREGREHDGEIRQVPGGRGARR